MMKKIFFLLFLFASLLRLSGAVINRDAYDDHFLVIETIAYEHRIPGKEDLACLQCYHPKLYHLAAASLVTLFSLEKEVGLRIVSQLLSAVAGIATLYFIFLFLKKQTLRESTKIATFALVAFNPALLGINIQATNDSFVILFSTGALFFLLQFFETEEKKDAFLLILFAILAALSKGSGLVVLGGIALVLGIKFIAHFFSSQRPQPYAWSLGALILLTLPCIIFFTPYDDYLRQYGSPLSINKELSPRAHFFERTSVSGKTGIASLYDGYFTFRPLDLMRNPFLDRESAPDSYAPSRISLWTQLYARASFTQYEGRPKDWFTKTSNPVYLIGRVIFLLALIPLFFFVWGIGRETSQALRTFFTKGLTFFSTKSDWVLLFFFFLFMASIIKFTYDYREYSAMKPMYTFPALLSFVFLFARGIEYFQEKMQKPYFMPSIFISFCLLLALQITSFLFLLIKLS